MVLPWLQDAWLPVKASWSSATRNFRENEEHNIVPLNLAPGNVSWDSSQFAMEKLYHLNFAFVTSNLERKDFLLKFRVLENACFASTVPPRGSREGLYLQVLLSKDRKHC